MQQDAIVELTKLSNSVRSAQRALLKIDPKGLMTSQWPALHARMSREQVLHTHLAEVQKKLHEAAQMVKALRDGVQGELDRIGRQQIGGQP